MKVFPVILLIVFSALTASDLARAQSPVPPYYGVDRSGGRGDIAVMRSVPTAEQTAGHQLNPYQIQALQRLIAGAAAVDDTLTLIGIQVQFADSLMGGQEGSRREGQPRDSTYFANTLKHTSQYFDGASRQLFTLSWEVTDKIYTMPENMGYYGDDAYEDVRVVEMMQTVIDSADDDIDFSRYETVMLIHAGAGQETDINDDSREQLWSSFYSRPDIDAVFPDSTVYGLITNDSLGGEPFLVDNFMVVPEDASQDGLTVGMLGIWCFEVGSRLGFLPLFDSTPPAVPDSRGVGDFDLMSSGLFNVLIDANLRLWPGFIPGFPCVFNRLIAGWVEPRVVEEDESFILRDLNTPQPGDTACIKIPISEREYFLVVNRVHDTNFDSVFTFSDFDSNFFPDNTDSLGGAEFDFWLTATTNPFGVVADPDYNDAPRYVAHTGSGVYVWHIDENVILQAIAAGHLPNDFVTRKGVDLEEADGIQDMDMNSGPFASGSHFDSYRDGNNQIFGPETRPASMSNTAAWTGIEVSDISPPGPVMTGTIAVTREYSEVRRRWAARGAWQPPSVVNLDGSGDLEIVVFADTGYVYAFSSDGSEFVDADGDPATIDPYIAAPGATWIGPPAFGDIDGDDDDEIINTSVDGSVYAWNGDGSEVVDGDGNAGTIGVLYRGLPLAAPPMLVDVNADGTDEIVIVEVLSDTLELGFVNGSGEKNVPSGADFQIVWPAKVAAQYCAPLAYGAVGDSNRDTEGVVITSVDTTASLYRLDYFPLRAPVTGPSASQTQAATITPAGPLPGSFPATSPPTVADLDGNGADEVVFTLSDNRLVVFNPSLKQASGGADESLRIIGLRSTRPSATALADVDGNGTVEIALWDDGFFYLYEHNARLRTNWPQPLREVQLGDILPLSFNRVMSSPLLADVNGNGRQSYLVPAIEGTLYQFDADGARDNTLNHPIPDGSGATPTLANLKGDDSVSLVSLGIVSSIGGVDAVSDTIESSDEMVLSIQSFPQSYGRKSWMAYQFDNRRQGRLELSYSPGAPGNLVEPGSFKIYPNPVRGTSVHARVVLNNSATVNVEIYNLEGERAASQTYQGNIGNVVGTPFDEAINVSQLKSGIYMMRIVLTGAGGSESQVKKFAILR
ncbi:MAG: T9SS type A sorting domain-containing protein [Candidatus Latescibacterota bacterium]|nr:MAG: T9SS type A sorting domain-containing protein [Candidatus Latescibacterota bacterium]